MQANPEAELHVVQAIAFAKVEEELLEDEDGPRAAQDDERLSREEAEQDAGHGSAQEALHHPLVIVRGIAQEPSEGDGVGDAAEVDEENGGDGLDVEAIVEVAEEPGQLPLDVQAQAAEAPA